MSEILSAPSSVLKTHARNYEIKLNDLAKGLTPCLTWSPENSWILVSTINQKNWYAVLLGSKVGGVGIKELFFHNQNKTNRWRYSKSREEGSNLILW